MRAPWQSILAGVSSSLFTALYPIQLLRTYRTFLTDLTPQGDILMDLNSDSDSSDPPPPFPSATPPGTRAAYKVLHTTSLLSLAALLPLLLLFTHELPQLRRNCYFLDVPWFWFLIACSGLGAFIVFTSTLLLVKHTSPVEATFVSVPRSAFQLAILSKGRMPAYSWVGVGLCWLGSAWFVGVKRREGRSKLGRLERG